MKPSRYGLDVKLVRTPFKVARWPKDKDGNPTSNIKGNLQVFRDMNENPVVLLEQEWDLNWAQRENPKVVFATSISRAR